MQYKDYYETLGVAKSASEKDIRQAYRRLARAHHPDVNPGDKQAEERFKEINEAYQVLSDPAKRQKYDQLGADWQRWQQAGGAPGGFDWTRWTAGGGPGFEVRYGAPEDLSDLFSGGGFSDFFREIFGMGGTRQRSAQRQRSYSFGPQRGQDLEQEVEITLEEAYSGTSRIVERDGRRLEVKIPAGARSGTKVRFAREGGSGVHGGQAGDLYLRVRVSPHAVFERKGADLHMALKIDLYTALLGGQVQVPALSGPVTLTIKPMTQNGQVIRLRGKGMPKLTRQGEAGDLYARVDVQLPSRLTPRQRQLLEEMRRGG